MILANLLTNESFLFVCQLAETKATKCNSAMINLIIYTCAFPTVKRQTGFCVHGNKILKSQMLM